MTVYGYKTLGDKVHPAVTWAELQDVDLGPAYLRGYGIVAKDDRLVGQRWVPWDLVNDTSRWTLLTNIDASTFVPGSLPYGGWSVSGGVGGSAITVANNEILITATPGNAELLTYTPVLNPTDCVRIVCKGYAKSVTSGSDANYVAMYVALDAALNSYILWIQDRGTTHKSNFSGNGFTAYMMPIATAQTWELILNPNGVTDSYVSSSHLLSDINRVADSTVGGSVWVAGTGTEFLSWRSTAGGGGAGNTVFALEWAAIYKGVM